MAHIAKVADPDRIYRAQDDVCGYVTDTPDPLLEAANSLSEKLGDLVTEAREDFPEHRATLFALRNLAREAASRSGRVDESDRFTRISAYLIVRGAFKKAQSIVG